MHNKEYFVNEYLNSSSKDMEKVDELISCLEAYISENEYDMQLELILHDYRTYKAGVIEDCYEKSCKKAAPIFELLQATDWDWLEIQILASAIGYVPYYTMGWELMQKAFNMLDNEFSSHKSRNFTKFRFHMNFTLRLLRARYYDDTDPGDIQTKFDHCIQQAIAFCEKNDYETFRLVLLVRQAVFYGDADKILEYIDELRATEDKVWIRTTTDEVVEYFQRLGRNITTSLKNLIVGWQVYKRRQALGMSTRELADAVDMSVGNINTVERGVRGVTYANLCKLADVLNIDISYFYAETDTRPANVITDATTHKIVQLLSKMSEHEKEYLHAFIKDFIKFNNNAD